MDEDLNIIQDYTTWFAKTVMIDGPLTGNTPTLTLTPLQEASLLFHAGDHVQIKKEALPDLCFVYGGEDYFKNSPELIGKIESITYHSDTNKSMYYVSIAKHCTLQFNSSDMKYFNKVDVKEKPIMKQFIDKTKHYPGGTKFVYVGSNLSEQTMKGEMYPLLEKGRHYTLYFDKQANHDWICLVGILQEDDYEECCRLSLDNYSFMEVKENDYDILKENPERMKEFAKTALQYILNNPRIYYAIKTNMEYLAKEKEFNEHLELEEKHLNQ